jgi:phosphate transport system permease protein
MVPIRCEAALCWVSDGRWSHIDASSAPGDHTGVLLTIPRVSGETAPLLFTALNSPYWSADPTQPIGTLNVTMFNYAMSPYADWRQLAWGAAFVITAGVLVLTVLARVIRGKAS